MEAARRAAYLRGDVLLVFSAICMMPPECDRICQQLFPFRVFPLHVRTLRERDAPFSHIF